MAISCVVIGIQTTCKHKIVHVQCRTCYQQHVIYLIEEICIEIRTFEKMKNPHLQFNNYTAAHQPSHQLMLEMYLSANHGYVKTLHALCCNFIFL